MSGRLFCYSVLIMPLDRGVTLLPAECLLLQGALKEGGLLLIKPVLRLDPLRHVLSALVLVMTQHAAGKVVSSDVGQIPLAFDDPLDQGRAMNGFPVTAGEQGLRVR